MKLLKENPADSKKDSMWDFLKTGKAEPNIPALKQACWQMINMVTQMTSGQRADHPNDTPFELNELFRWQIVCEACALVADGYFDNDPLKIEDLKEDMWIWDNWCRRWIHIYHIDDECRSKRIFYVSDKDEMMEFMENRFYRKMVE